MTHPPAFWSRDSWQARLLSPFSHLTARITANRLTRPGYHASIPVLCCGNATAGGAGKTTLVLDLAQRLLTRGIQVHILLRGYGGSAKGPRRVQPGDTVAVTGDEALLLARLAPAWTGGDRGASARAALAEGAECLILDDGLQNPSLRKTMSLLTVDGATGFGNGRVLPAGPLREPVAAAAARCAAAVLIGPDHARAAAQLPETLPILRARLEQGPEVGAFSGEKVLAFAGIGIPEKFFSGLEQHGVILAAREAFPDHHAYTPADLDRLVAQAKTLDLPLLTTPKDAVRLPAAMRARVQVVGVRMVWEKEAEIEALLDSLLAPPSPRTHPGVA